MLSSDDNAPINNFILLTGSSNKRKQYTNCGIFFKYCPVFLSIKISSLTFWVYLSIIYLLLLELSMVPFCVIILTLGFIKIFFTASSFRRNKALRFWNVNAIC